MISEAQRRAAGLNLPVDFHLGSSYDIEFTSGTFDGCRADRILLHLENPAQALSEMVRILRPGGKLVVFDFDWETLIVDAAERIATRKILNVLCDCSGSRWIGRQLFGLLTEVGLIDINASPETMTFTDYHLARRVFAFQEAAAHAVTIGVATPLEASGWLADLERRHSAGRFFAGLTGFCVSGRKPIPGRN